MDKHRTTLRSKIREDYLTCPICFGRFTTPKALPCLHTFCEKCIGDYASGYQSLGRFPCPQCRMDIFIPQGGVHYFQDNHMVNSLTETVESNNNLPSMDIVLPPRPDPEALSKLQIPNSNSGAGQAGTELSPSWSIPEIPPHTDSYAPPPPRSTVDIVSSRIVEGISGAVGHVGAVLSDYNPLRPRSTDGSSGGNRTASLGAAHMVHEQGESRRSPGLYPELPDPLDKSGGPCTEGMLMKFGQYGPGISDFLTPYGLCVGHAGEFVVSDKRGNRIFVFSNSGELQARFNTAECVVNDIIVTKENNILVAVSNAGSAIMRMYSMHGHFLKAFGDYYKFDKASGITVTPKNQVAITNIAADNVLIFTDQRKFSTKFGRKGTGINHFMQPRFITSTSKGYVVVSDTGSHTLKMLDTTGIHKRSFGGLGNQHGHLNTPLGIATDAEDNILVADSKNFRVEVFTRKGLFHGTVVQETNLIGPDVQPINVAVTPSNNVAVLLKGTGFAEVRLYAWQQGVGASGH